jgi:hypothetical protein
MNRTWVALVALILSLAAIPVAQAHGPSLLAFVTVDAGTGQLAVKLADFYGSPFEGARLTASVTKPGQKPGKAIVLKEAPAGTYTTGLTKGQPGVVQVELNMVFQNELFKAAFNTDLSEGQPELILPLMEVGPAPAGFPWNWVGYGAAALALAAGSAVAVRRRARHAQAA